MLCKEMNGHNWAMQPTSLTKYYDNGTCIFVWTFVTDLLLNLKHLFQVLISSYIKRGGDQLDHVILTTQSSSESNEISECKKIYNLTSDWKVKLCISSGIVIGR